VPIFKITLYMTGPKGWLRALYALYSMPFYRTEDRDYQISVTLYPASIPFVLAAAVWAWVFLTVACNYIAQPNFLADFISLPFFCLFTLGFSSQKVVTLMVGVGGCQSAHRDRVSLLVSFCLCLFQDRRGTCLMD